MAIRKLKVALNPITGKFDLVNDVSNMVDGPAVSTNQAIARFVGTTGKEVTNSAVTISNVGMILTPDSMQVGRDASSALEVVTKQQLDGAISGVDVKESVRAATLGPITLSGLITVDGVALNANDRVLVKNLVVQQENGIYVASAGLWSRANDADQGSELEGALVTVREGTQANTGWYQTSDSVIVGTTPIVWTQFFGAGTYTADELGIKLTGSTFGLDLDGTTLSQGASGLRVAVGGIGNLEIQGGAAISRSKIAAGNINRFVVNDGFSGSLGEVAVTPSRAMATDSNGLPVASTTTAAELNFVSGVTSAIQTQLNAKEATITGAATTITTADLTVDRAVISNGSGKVAVSAVTSTELGYVSGVTSAIQTQLNAKQATITGAATTITSADLTVDRAVVSDGSGKVAVSAVTGTELGYVSGVTSAIQTQLNGKEPTITGAASTVTNADLATNAVVVSNLAGKITTSPVSSIELGYLLGVTSAIQTQLNGKINNSVLSAKGSLVGASAAATPVDVPVGANGDYLVADSTQTAGVRWASRSVPVTVTLLASGSGTYTVPAGVVQLRVRLYGGGGGGGGNGSGGPQNGGTGAVTSFGTLTAAGGEGAQAYQGGGGGSATGGNLANFTGFCGQSTPGNTSPTLLQNYGGGGGGAGGGKGGTNGGTTGTAGTPNTGGGGGGGGTGAAYAAPAGGGSGGYCEHIYNGPALVASYSYSVGAGGLGGVGTGAGSASGGDGGSGVILIEEYY